MAARLVEIYLPDSRSADLEAILAGHCRKFWRVTVPGAEERYSCLVQQRYVERLLDELQDAFGSVPSFSAYVAQLEAVLPVLEETPASALPENAATPEPTRLERFFSRDRLSTDELYDDIADSLHIRPSYLLLVLFSGLIAGLGMRSGQTAVVIGAMIIAPLLGPSMGMAMAATVGDRKLGKQASATLLVGSLLAVLAGAFVGWTVEIDPLVAELRDRTIVQPADIALALACGAAGVLAFTRGSSLTLVGVMIAVALVPPLAATGIFLAQGSMGLSAGAFYLFAINLVCINVSGIATLLFQGLPPRNWRMTGGILTLWIIILALLASMMVGRFAFNVMPASLAGLGLP